MVIKKNKNLNIFVINKGLGESIILKTPEDKWGVIDCYSSNLSNSIFNPVLKFLNDNEVKELEFIALTHPHNDHYRGLSQILKHFRGRIKKFWRFSGINPKFLKWLKENKINIKSKNPGENILEINKIFSEVRLQMKGGLDLGLLIADQPIYNAKDLNISVLAPNANVINSFDESLRFAEEYDLPFSVSDSGNENRISGTIGLKYGEMDYIFFGDSDNYAQKEFLKDIKKSDTKFKPAFIKVSHHGSRDGHFKPLWENFNCSNGKTISVITPYIARRLPRKSVVSQIASNSKLHFPVRLNKKKNKNKTPSKSKTVFHLISYKDFQAPISNFGIVSFEFDINGNLVSNEKAALAV